METTASPKLSESSAFSRMFNVLAAPGEVFAEIKERPVEHSNWLVPAIVWFVVGVASIFILFGQDWAMNDLRKAQDKGIDQQVASGKITRQQADQAQDIMKRFMPLFVKVGGSVMMVVYAFGLPFFWGFIIWLAGVKFLKGDFEYMKAVEAAGLATVIYMLAGVVGLLFCFVMGKLAYISAALFLKEFDFTNRLHFALGALNPFYLWFAAALASATATFAGVSWARAAGWIFGLWILTRALLIAIKLGQFTM
jgi:hypothetical protein